MSDVGLAALEKIHKQLQIDEPWTIRRDREFSWIGHRLRQNVRASKRFDDDGISLSRLAASCVVVEGVRKPDRDVLRILSWVNRHAVGSAYTYQPSTRSISSNAVAFVHDETLEWRTKQFASLVILQLCLAETEADWLADRTGAAVAICDHPTSGRRVDPDDMLNVLESVFAKAGRQPSLFSNKFEMETIAETTQRSTKAASFGGDADGVALEVSFAESTSLTLIKTEEPHRRLGNGLTARLNLPITVTPDVADQMAAALNSQEASVGPAATHYGAWCWDEWPTTGFGIAYQTFVPNALHQPGITQDVAYSFVKRAQWIDQILNGKPSESNVWRTLTRRFGSGRPNDGED